MNQILVLVISFAALQIVLVPEGCEPVAIVMKDGQPHAVFYGPSNTQIRQYKIRCVEGTATIQNLPGYYYEHLASVVDPNSGQVATFFIYEPIQEGGTGTGR